jgi:hypothetical protein
MMMDPSPNKAINDVVLECHDLTSHPLKNGMFDHSGRKQSLKNSDPCKGGESKNKIT